MRLNADDADVRNVIAFLTRDEAFQLRHACDELLEYFDSPGWHKHVSSADYQTEITLAPEIDSPEGR